MNKLFIVTLAILFAFSPAFVVGIANAATLDWASAVESFVQGTQKSGAPVILDRSDPSKALGANDGEFVSLGFDGELVLEFPVKAGGVLTIQAFEVTTGPYDLETAEVLVSDDGMSFVSVGTADNDLGEGDGITEFALRDQCVKYVKLVNTTDPELHNDSADGFDVDAVSIEYDEECQEPEEECTICSQGDDKVYNFNEADIRNDIRIKANTGGNFADGSYGGDGGDGGSIMLNGGEEGDVEESSTGNGGNGGGAGMGGTVITGNAFASGSLSNIANENDTAIDRCACREENCCEEFVGDCLCCDGDDTKVKNMNRASLENELETRANTGYNEVMGSYGGRGGNGGIIVIGENGYLKPIVFNNEFNGHDGSNGEVDESSTGTGGIGGAGAEGGLVQTGVSTAWAEVVNMVNRSITRIMR